MENQKLDNQLNLALDVGEQMRAETENLNTGYDESTRRWELIVKYSGDLSRLSGEGIEIEELIAGYAIVTIPESLIESFSGLEEVEYIEKPKKIYPQIIRGLSASCFFPLLNGTGVVTEPLDGSGIYIAVIDSGIDYTMDMFRNSDGSTKIDYLWDQGKVADPELSERPPRGFAVGVEYTREAIDENLQSMENTDTAGNPLSDRRSPDNLLSVDVTGHGTKVAAIATQGAPGSRFIIVKLDTANQMSYPATTSLMRAFTYVVRKATEINRPVAVNLSYGNTYGSHDGNSLLERFIDNISEVGRSVICVGSGNEGASAGHFAGNIAGTQPQRVEFVMGNYERTFSLQIWKNYEDIFDVDIFSPGGQSYRIPGQGQNGTARDIVLEQTRLLIYSGKPQPYRTREEIYIDFLPVEDYLNEGVWQIVLTPEKIVSGMVQMYMPSEVVRSGATRFLRPSPDVTLTIPSTSERVITVGAYQAFYGAYADFSGRGFVLDAADIGVGLAKPDIVAPGVGIRVPGRFGEEVVNGTSYATPFVTAASALLMEWGIEKGNDPYLYGEKVKAYLRAGARPLSGETEYPNERVGYGSLCVADSIPRG